MLVRKFVGALAADLDSNTRRGRLVRSAAITVAIKIGAILIAFIASLVYARTLGPLGYGQLSYVMAWVALLTIPASLGLPNYIIREGAKSPTALRHIRAWADSRVLFSGVFFAVILLTLYLVPQRFEAKWLFLIAAPLPLLNNFSDVRQSVLKAQGLIVSSLWPSTLLSPSVVVAISLAIWGANGTLSAHEVLAATAVAAILTLAINQLQAARLPTDVSLRTQLSVRSALPFMALGILSIINIRTDTIMLGIIKGEHDAGIYSVASRISELIPFLMVTANLVIAPQISKLYHQQQLSLLQDLLTAVARRVLFLTTPFALAVLVFAPVLLKFVFGSAYVVAAPSLQILAVAQFLNVLAGPTRSLLNMTGHEKLTVIGVGVAAVVNVVLNVVLIPHFGVEGAALATGVSMFLWNALLWYWIRARLNLTATAFRV